MSSRLELPTQQPDESFEDYVERLKAAALEQVEQDMERAGYVPHEQFGNNFFMLFSEYLFRKSRDHVEPVASLYLDRMEEQYPDQWQSFLAQNQELLAQMKPLLKLRDEGSLGPYENSHAFWAELNPLLKQAAEVLQAVGINPEEFYR